MALDTAAQARVESAVAAARARNDFPAIDDALEVDVLDGLDIVRDALDAVEGDAEVEAAEGLQAQPQAGGGDQRFEPRARGRRRLSRTLRRDLGHPHLAHGISSLVGIDRPACHRSRQ